jgi:hypothetical protein
MADPGALAAAGFKNPPQKAAASAKPTGTHEIS